MQITKALAALAVIIALTGCVSTRPVRADYIIPVPGRKPLPALTQKQNAMMRKCSPAGYKILLKRELILMRRVDTLERLIAIANSRSN